MLTKANEELQKANEELRHTWSMAINQTAKVTPGA